MKKFTDSPHCLSKMHCQACRNDPAFRNMLRGIYEWDGDCPYGHTTLSLPPVSEQLVNAAKAVVRVAVATAEQKPVFAEPDEVERRRGACAGCEFWIADRRRCSKCGCYTNKKILLATEKCPAGNW